MRALRLALATTCIATHLSAETLNCSDPQLRVTGGDAEVRALTCSAASESRKQLESCGVTLDRSVDINIVKDFSDQTLPCLGIYHCGEDRIDILSPFDMSQARDREGSFELVSDEAYWKSVIAHELTHAAYDTVACPFSSCVATAEYAAYTMQVFSLPDDQRALFGETIKLKSKPSRDAISPVILYMSPDHFSKFAWLHFQNLEAPCDYMQLIMNGQIYFDMEPL